MGRDSLKNGATHEEWIDMVRRLEQKGAEGESHLKDRSFKCGLFSRIPTYILGYPMQHLTEDDFVLAMGSFLSDGRDYSDKTDPMVMLVSGIFNRYSEWKTGSVRLSGNPEIVEALEAADAAGVTAYITSGLKQESVAVKGEFSTSVAYPLDDTWGVYTTSADALLSGSDEAMIHRS